MSSRDCEMWQTVFVRVCNLLSVDLNTTYFLTSRLARTSGSTDYRRYASEMLAGKSVWVDLCGTGWSMSLLCDELDLKDQHLALVHQIARLSAYETVAQTSTCGTSTKLVAPDVRDLDSGLFEMSNYACHPMVVDVEYDGCRAVPVYAPEYRGARELALVESQQAATRVGTSRLTSEVINEMLALTNESRRDLVVSLYRVLVAAGGDLWEAFGPSHLSEDEGISGALGIVPSGRVRSRLEQGLRKWARIMLFRDGPLARQRGRIRRHVGAYRAMNAIRESRMKS